MRDVRQLERMLGGKTADPARGGTRIRAGLARSNSTRQYVEGIVKLDTRQISGRDADRAGAAGR